MSEPACVEIFIIGNEILIGDIQDTNTHWLCKEINELGGQVVRATVMRDSSEVIAAEMQAALLRGADVIITSGGLGPTANDLTLAAVARGVGVEWRLHEQALQMIRVRSMPKLGVQCRPAPYIPRRKRCGPGMPVGTKATLSPG